MVSQASFSSAPNRSSEIELSIEDDASVITRHGCDSDGTSFSTMSLSSTVNNEQEKATWRQKYWPPRGWVAKWLTWFLVLAAVLGSIWSVFPQLMAQFDKTFSLLLTILLCIAAEQLVVKIPTPKGLPPLPPLLASLLMGLALRNIPVINIAVHIDGNVNSILRNVALTVILTRAGLEIEPDAINKMKRAVLSLGFVPCLVETATIGVVGHAILNFPYTWAFLTGFLISAASSAVIVPSLIILQDSGYGVDNGVPSLIMAACSIEDILAIAGFTVFLGIAIPETDSDVGLTEFNSTTTMDTNYLDINSTMEYPENYTYTGLNSTTSVMNYTISETQATIGKDVVSALLQVIVGLVSGLVLGLFISYFPDRNMRYKNFCRGALLLLVAILVVFGSAVLKVPGAGPLCALTMTFTASLHWKEEVKPLAEAWHYMWVILQPILFGLTGALVDVSIMDATTVGLGLATLFVGLVLRSMTSMLVTFGLNFNLKEKLFVAISWIPKGTVQAALGSAALDRAREMSRPDTEIAYGQQILALAVLITLITAPTGGFGINLTGTRLLRRTPQQEPNPKDNEAYTGTDIESCSSGYDSDIFQSGSEESRSSGLELMSIDASIDIIEESKDGKEENTRQGLPSSDSTEITKF